jgi:iron(III) transport system ATP-binding protein
MSDIFTQSSSTTPFAHGKAGPVFAGQLGVEGVGYVAKGKVILDDISLSVAPGEIACLLGPSGCGKTTLLGVIAGILRPTAGRITLDGLEIAGPRVFVPPEKRNIGLVFQDFALFPHMTALQNVAYGLYALERNEALRVAALTLDRVGLGHALNRYPVLLSGGEQQRVALARALVPRPQVILLDEPFSGLDQRLKDTVREETLSLLRETRATAILVTHDPMEALSFSDQIHVMQAGRLAQSGSPDELMQKPNSRAVAQFFHRYNCFSGIVTNSMLATPLGPVSVNGFSAGSHVEAMVPPNAIFIVPQGQGAAATVIENRDLGVTRRISLRLHATGERVEVRGPYVDDGEVGLVLGSGNIHIFAKPAQSQT